MKRDGPPAVRPFFHCRLERRLRRFLVVRKGADGAEAGDIFTAQRRGVFRSNAPERLNGRRRFPREGAKSRRAQMRRAGMTACGEDGRQEKTVRIERGGGGKFVFRMARHRQ